MKKVGERTADLSLDQTRAIAREDLSMDDLKVSSTEREVLRRLAGDVAALAMRPIESEKCKLWTKHNALEQTRPLVFCDPENGWKEIITPDRLECENPLARRWEMRLRKEIFWGAKMGDDRTVQRFFDIPYVHGGINWGLGEVRIGERAGGAYTWEQQINTEDDIAKLRYPHVEVDRKETARLVAIAEEIFGDLLPVRIKTMFWWALAQPRRLLEWRGGMTQLMYDFIDNPNLIHRLMTIVRDGTMAMLDQLEEEGLLSLNNDGTYVGSGGLGWTDELPQPDFSGKVRCADMWGFCESQETVGISPKMFAEFVFPYQLPILERFGLNCYGCCEPLQLRWHIIKQIPNLRRVSVSAWADWAKIAEMLGDKYIYSLKPNPADLAMESFNEDYIRAGLREALRITRGCHVEIIMKDNHTIRGDPQRVIRWVQIAREEAENVLG